MTEEEAKTKDCPFTFSRGLAEAELCIGSACMAWRVLLEIEPEDAKNIAELPIVRYRVAGGYCGLAGEP